MKVTPSVVQDEFIGLEACVAKCLNPSVVGLKGLVIDETRNTFTLSCNRERKVVIKDTAVFDFILSNGTGVQIDGNLMVGRSEDRLKKRIRRVW
ncbi:MAG: ribonuclease P protein subunit [Candidatus Bathyarchaeota archaeon]|nr:ribonuclease P protein subunit [Candidatus Bathyarchaeum tardum]WGM89169.1 MAG: ribonuclease P protein subunit [Candidatus Bathyarchaeum tardum]WNZ28591.1 MAG: ribonuclease P protein subunit [Candidatus Bathyarchaeota archaeon]